MALLEQGDLLKVDSIQQPVIVVRISFYTPLPLLQGGITGYNALFSIIRKRAAIHQADTSNELMPHAWMASPVSV